jgi:hypothetical protein
MHLINTAVSAILAGSVSGTTELEFRWSWRKSDVADSVAGRASSSFVDGSFS